MNIKKGIDILRIFITLSALLLLWAASFSIAGTMQNPAAISYEQDDDQGRLTVEIDGKEAFVYQYSEQNDLPHFYPLRSPAGKSMLVQKTQPYPHHRAFWFADKVRKPGGRAATLYNALYTGADRKDPPYRDSIKHVEFENIESDGNCLDCNEKLVWTMDYDVPLLDEQREVCVTACGNGEYLLDIRFTVTASYGDIEFVSDDVHYAWPYLRMNEKFSVKGGGRIVNSGGGVNQSGTNGKEADWVDYSNTSDDKNGGLTVMSHPENAKPHRWLTRDYGTFGPRRIDARSGKQFTLKEGESLKRRVGVLVHRGDHETGRVAERYAEYEDRGWGKD